MNAPAARALYVPDLDDELVPVSEVYGDGDPYVWISRSAWSDGMLKIAGAVTRPS